MKDDGNPYILCARIDITEQNADEDCMEYAVSAKVQQTEDQRRYDRWSRRPIAHRQSSEQDAAKKNLLPDWCENA